jgi:alkanesulfonate monooxygenase SsuD/methylene tetrahydromethanopterin reductase-like flavin-dependent oxidoreductase (luciferase family)
VTATLRLSVLLDRARSLRAGDVAAAARHVEELGLDGLFVGDHLAGAVPMLDGTILLGAAAAATERIALGFAVMVPALRHVAWAAKQIATLQQVSGDRLVLGLGSGAPIHGRDAWDAVDIPYAQRGARFDAALNVLADLVTGRAVELGQGRVLTLEPSATMPPVWIGGNSARALRRAAEHGDGWFPSMVAPSRVAQGAAVLCAEAQRLGRPEPVVAVSCVVRLSPARTTWALDLIAASLQNGHRAQAAQIPPIPITGDPIAAAERFDEYQRAGAAHLVLGILGDDWERQCELLADARVVLG